MRDSEEFDVPFLEEGLAVGVPRALLRVEMNAAVDFDGKPPVVAVEVDHEAADSVLAAEFQAIQPAAT